VDLNDALPQMSRQLELPFTRECEARNAERSEEASWAIPEPPVPGTKRLMEQVTDGDNLKTAWRRVRKNKGSPGIDGMTVRELGPYLRENLARIREELLAGTYQPQPVRQKLIPKGNGKTRMLRIPTVTDRFVQQALLQFLQPIYEPTFSDHSHGFRPGRSTHGALREARAYVRSGRVWVVDVDLSKFLEPSSDYPRAVGVGSKSPGIASGTCILKPFRRPRET
jgi:RNA-directed DNA polymerase